MVSGPQRRRSGASDGLPRATPPGNRSRRSPRRRGCRRVSPAHRSNQIRTLPPFDITWAAEPLPVEPGCCLSRGLHISYTFCIHSTLFRLPGSTLTKCLGHQSAPDGAWKSIPSRWVGPVPEQENQGSASAGGGGGPVVVRTANSRHPPGSPGIASIHGGRSRSAETTRRRDQSPGSHGFHDRPTVGTGTAGAASTLPMAPTT